METRIIYKSLFHFFKYGNFPHRCPADIFLPHHPLPQEDEAVEAGVGRPPQVDRVAPVFQEVPLQVGQQVALAVDNAVAGGEDGVLETDEIISLI